MINNANLLAHATHTMRQMEPGDVAIYRTYKKDRSVSIECRDDGFAVVEDGFEQRRWDGLDTKGVLKLLKHLREVEFPRSNKLYNSLRSNRQLQMGMREQP